MSTFPGVTRRQFLQRSALGLAYLGTQLILPRPTWASSRTAGLQGLAPQNSFELEIGPAPVNIAGRNAIASGINGSVPGPLLRWREGETVALDVRNALDASSSIHWHGMLLPTNMDGVPGLSFGGIDPQSSYAYEFPVRQNGTYWYHSHSGFQEQLGVYGPIIIDAVEPEPFTYDSEFVLMLSDWTFEDPDDVMKNLKIRDDYYNYNRRTVGELFADARDDGWSATMADRRMWGSMRMKAADIADITAATYSFLLNGLDAGRNWTGLFTPGQRIRLRVINGSAQTFFNVRIPGLEMTVVQADGQNVDPVDIDEFQIGVAETYDVIVQPTENRAYTIFAESMDRSGFVRGTLAPQAGMTAPVPALRKSPRVSMRDMGMQHEGMGHAMDGSEPGDPPVDHSAMGHATMGHATMDHGTMDHAAMGHGTEPRDQLAAAGMEHGHEAPPTIEHRHRRGPGVANITATPLNRLDEPGAGLANVGHRVLRYSQLRSRGKNPDQRKPARELEVHLTGNMERYMWSFDGVKYSEVTEPIRFVYGERLRLVLVNDTMMAHPIHLHGMFMELVNGNGDHNPRKHTVIVKPAERLALDITADEPGHWAFHCHMLYHMKAGMMHSVLVEADEAIS